MFPLTVRVGLCIKVAVKVKAIGHECRMSKDQGSYRKPMFQSQKEKEAEEYSRGADLLHRQVNRERKNRRELSVSKRCKLL